MGWSRCLEDSGQHRPAPVLMRRSARPSGPTQRRGCNVLSVSNAAWVISCGYNADNQMIRQDTPDVQPQLIANGEVQVVRTSGLVQARQAVEHRAAERSLLLPQ